MEKRIHADNMTLPITKGPFSVDDALPGFRQIGERVAGVNKRGIIHCGLKPFKKTFLFLWLIILSSILTIAQGKKLREPDVEYEPSPQNVVERMLKLANVQKGDVVYDLGCGDGRIVITAAKQFGATGVGIDIDPIRIKESLQNAREAGVIERVTFRLEDLFTADIKEATVVTLFLSPSVNLKLRPKLLSELKPGTRVVSYYWDMDDWMPDKRIDVDGDPIYLWTIPTKRASKHDSSTMCESGTF